MVVTGWQWLVSCDGGEEGMAVRENERVIVVCEWESLKNIKGGYVKERMRELWLFIMFRGLHKY